MNCVKMAMIIIYSINFQQVVEKLLFFLQSQKNTSKNVCKNTLNKKVIVEDEDKESSIDYDDDDPNIEQRKNRWNYWEALKKVRKEYMAQNKEFDAYDFEDYLLGQYGLKMNIVNGNITDGYQIVDEKKYLIFLLKFQ